MLSQTGAWMMLSIAPVLGYALETGAAELPTQAAAFQSHGLAAVESVLSHRIEHMRPLVDPRVLRRVSRDLWNSCAGVSPSGLQLFRSSQIHHVMQGNVCADEWPHCTCYADMSTEMHARRLRNLYCERA